jgi:hypothetical protein
MAALSRGIFSESFYATQTRVHAVNGIIHERISQRCARAWAMQKVGRAQASLRLGLQIVSMLECRHDDNSGWVPVGPGD